MCGEDITIIAIATPAGLKNHASEKVSELLLQ
jgi:hypothetical protein